MANNGDQFGVIDMRSDTVTQPTDSMRRAMAGAIVGDDEYGEDPTVNALQDMVAERMGKESALFVTSGTMSNLIALLTHCDIGGCVAAGQLSHLVRVEAGSAKLGRFRLLPIPERLGIGLDSSGLSHLTRGSNAPDVICVENTHSFCGGIPVGVKIWERVLEAAQRTSAAVHVDGARIFNAEVATSIPAATLVSQADSVSFCVSKGLAAPMGSLLCGSRAFVERARRIRGFLGGGLRQAGVVAAAARVAVEQMVDRLVVDHANAAKLSAGLSGLGFQVEQPVVTNMVFVNVPDARKFVLSLASRCVRVLFFGTNRVRFVTHAGISDCCILDALSRIREISTSAEYGLDGTKAQ